MASKRQRNALLDLKGSPPKRARKDVANNKSPLLSLPGEIRNRIYELALADIMQQLEGGRIRLRDELLNPIHIDMQFTINARCPTIEELKSWHVQLDERQRAEHGKRKYWGLVQACQLLRQEFRPLQLRTLPFTISAQYLDRYLYDFGTTEDALALGKSLKAIIKRPLIPDVRLDILPLLKKLSKQRNSLPWLTGPYHGNESLLFALVKSWAQPSKGLDILEPTIASVTLTMDNIHGTRDAPDRPSMIIGLRCARLTGLAPDEKRTIMLGLIKVTGLEKLRHFITEFRCCGRRYTWQMPGGQSGATETPMQIAEVQDED
ncbi:hypothetical protein J4E80_001646 [Alternaria sp. BMP 0032]|nr:hypothetical protein J4E80_001646 [Alternaria sp. BMP 0032]